MINSFVVAFTLFKMSLKKEKCTYWCFIVKGCVKGPARYENSDFPLSFLCRRRRRRCCCFVFTHNQEGIQRAGQTDPACWCFFQLRPFVKGKVSTGAVTLGYTCGQCRLHISGLSAAGASDYFPPPLSFTVQCKLWRFLCVFDCGLFFFTLI